MTDWAKLKPIAIPAETRAKLGRAHHNNNNEKNLEDEWLLQAKKINAGSEIERDHALELEQRIALG